MEKLHLQTKNKIGRPKVANKGKNRSFKLTDTQYAKLRLLGGVKWLKKMIEENHAIE